MLDKDEAKSTPEATSTTQSDTNIEASSDTKKESINKSVASKKADKTTNSAAKKVTTPAPKKPISKLALLAIFISASALTASTFHYIWQQEQAIALSQAIEQQRKQAINNSQADISKKLNDKFSQQLRQQLAQQQNSFNQQLKKVALLAHQESEGSVKQLSTQVDQLELLITQRKPSDWLIHEAEYLIRIAARTMWLERDTKAAIGLLTEADTRLNELKQPKYLPIRALINQDIAALSLMPVLESQQAILSLMALSKQVSQLPIMGVNLNEALDKSARENLDLSSDINDWQSNLNKTWQRFLNAFITVRRREGTVEPLMAPEQQQHLKQNLSLKIQLAQWAASEQQAKVFKETLLDIQTWMNEFFDMDADINQKFYQTIEQVKQHTIDYDYPSDLASLTAIQNLNNKAIATPHATKELEIKLDQAPKKAVVHADKDTSGDNL